MDGCRPERRAGRDPRRSASCPDRGACCPDRADARDAAAAGSGLPQWLSDEQLRRLEERIAETVRSEGASTDLEVRRLLETRVNEARGELEVAQKARERIDTVGTQLQERADPMRMRCSSR